MALDRVLIGRKLLDVDARLDELEEFRSIPVEAYAADWKTRRIVERTLQMLIESCADIASHIIAEEGLRVPQSLADAFRVLGEAEVVPADLVPALVRMAGFRNILVHRYDRIDPEIVLGVLRRHLDELVTFRQAITGWLESCRAG